MWYNIRGGVHMKKNRDALLLIHSLVCLLFIPGITFAEKVAPLPGLLVPQSVTIGNGRVYITEGTSIYIYSLNHLKLIKKFGREGEGPGELKRIIYRIDIRPDHIIVNSEGRISHFSLDGDFIKQANATATAVNYKPIGDRYVGMRFAREKKNLVFVIGLFNKKLAAVKEIHRFNYPFQPGKPINPTDIRICSYHVGDDKIFIDKENGVIDVYNRDGNKLYTIDPGIERIKISAAQKKRYLDAWKSSHMLREEYKAFKERLKFPKYFSYIRNFHVIDGKLYILTFKELNGANELLIYSLTGKPLKRTGVPLLNTEMLLPQVYNFYTIYRGKLYRLVENPDTEAWELHISGI
jgi:hypothetical protein